MVHIGKTELKTTICLYLYREKGRKTRVLGGGQKGVKKGVRGDTSLWAKPHKVIHD